MHKYMYDCTNTCIIPLWGKRILNFVGLNLLVQVLFYWLPGCILWNLSAQAVQSWGSGMEHLICFPRMGVRRVKRMSLQVHWQKNIHKCIPSCCHYFLFVGTFWDENRYWGPSRCRASNQWREWDWTGLICSSSSCFQSVQKMLFHPMFSMSLVTIPQFLLYSCAMSWTIYSFLLTCVSKAKLSVS